MSDLWPRTQFLALSFATPSRRLFNMPETPLLAKERLAKSILSTRKEKNISGDALCEKAGISRNTPHLIENKSANARLGTIMSLAAALCVDPCYFFGRDDHPPPSEERVQTFRTSVAATIQRYRTMREISQNELTKRAGLPWGYASQIERKSLDLTLDLLDKIATALDVGLPTFWLPSRCTSFRQLPRSPRLTCRTQPRLSISRLRSTAA
ncbi:helix-turn-helix transcriptional regulator [Paraburkholderia sediminicola]|uniref:helix-turn-helix domain-containing protein n=1 Tax=Paraburkholderia TaxID=1822464 RepID=UPI001455E588|nr:helix-turn-helix transcriptional regulator [Paraburkholderia aromaticivorans]